MNSDIDLLLSNFYHRGITSREQLLTEAIRVKKMSDVLQNENNLEAIKSGERLFQLMKKTTEQELGFFPGDRDFFVKIFELCKEVDIIDYTLEIYKNDRLGVIFSPEYLTKFINTWIDEQQPRTILIIDAEKHLSGLRGLLTKYPDKDFTLTTSSPLMFAMLNLGLNMFRNVALSHQSVYQELLITEKFDMVYCLPTFAGKVEEFTERFITNQTDSIAVENSLKVLSDEGTLIAIVPAKMTFTGGSFATLREYIIKNFYVDSIYILPEGTFRPYTAIKTYMLTISSLKKDSVKIGTVDFDKDEFVLHEQKTISNEEFLKHKDWRIEIILSDDDKNLQRYKDSAINRIKLKDIAEVFRGKSVLKKDVKPGSISILNISDIEDGEIRYTDMDTLDEEERKVKRYELIEGDLVLTCRGTSVKVAVFHQQKNIIIASANVIIIRSQSQVLGEYIKLFFESPIGITLIKSFQRGTTVMNINHTDIMEIEIPIVPMSQQLDIVEEYRKEFLLYKETVAKAENRWQEIKNKLYQKLY